MTEAHHLNAVVERGESLQVITEEYSRDAMTDLLKRSPEAIALAPAGALDASKLLTEFNRVSRRLLKTARTSSAQCYRWRPGREERLQFCGEIKDERTAPQQIEKLTKMLVGSVLVLVWHELNQLRTVNYDQLLESALAEATVDSHVAVAEPAESSDRKQLRNAREGLLARVPSFTSEDLASGGDSTSDNASQYALDLRNRGAVFGVRFGRAWRYPKFQFDARRRPFDEMKQVLEALSPDPKGWDRLQWFLTPHEKLGGKTPLQVWKPDRQEVIEAANTERWHGGRD
jgi:hypothetical protein